MVLSLRLISLQKRNTISCSRNPVSRNVENNSLSRSVVTAKKDARSSSVYSMGNGRDSLLGGEAVGLGRAFHSAYRTAR